MPDRPDIASPAATRTPRARRTLRVVGVAAVLGCALAVLYGMLPPGKTAAGACPAAEAATARLDPLIHGEVAAFGLGKPARLAPTVSFAGPDGQPLTLEALRGKVLLVNFWATWCGPCRKEMPALDRLQGALGGPGFEVVAVNVDTARLERPKAFLKEIGVGNLAFYADPSAEILQTLKEQGGLLGLPTTLLIDKEGCELGRMAGPAEWDSPDGRALIVAARG